MLSLLILSVEFYHVHSQCCSSASTYGTISCVDGSASFTANPRYNYYHVHFSTDKTEDITVSTCDSGFDTVTSVYGTPTPSTPTWYPVSAPTYSDGDDCSKNEEYTVSDVPAGDYVVIVYGYPTSPTCSCSPPTSSPLQVSITGCNTPNPTPSPTPSPTSNPTPSPTPNTVPPTASPTTSSPTTAPPTTAPPTTAPPTTAPPTTAPPTTAPPTTAPPTTVPPTTAAPTTESPTTTKPTTTTPTTDHPTTSNPIPKPTSSPEKSVSVVNTADARSNTPSSTSKATNVLSSLNNMWLAIFGGAVIVIGMVCCVTVMSLMYFHVKSNEIKSKQQEKQKKFGSMDSNTPNPNIQLPPTNTMKKVSPAPYRTRPPLSPQQNQPMPQPGSPQTQQEYALWMQQQQLQQEQMDAMMMHVQRQLLGDFSTPGCGDGSNAVQNIVAVDEDGENDLMDDMGDMVEAEPGQLP